MLCCQQHLVNNLMGHPVFKVFINLEVDIDTCLFVGLLLDGVDLEGELVDLPLGAPQQRQVPVLRLSVFHQPLERDEKHEKIRHCHTRKMS